MGRRRFQQRLIGPRPALVVWKTASYVKVPDRDNTPTDPFLKIDPGMIPILHSFGVISPGQLPPINRDFEFASLFFTRTISITGIPSVMHVIKSIPASMASSIAAAAPAGGT